MFVTWIGNSHAEDVRTTIFQKDFLNLFKAASPTFRVRLLKNGIKGISKGLSNALKDLESFRARANLGVAIKPTKPSLPDPIEERNLQLFLKQFTQMLKNIPKLPNRQAQLQSIRPLLTAISKAISNSQKNVQGVVAVL